MFITNTPLAHKANRAHFTYFGNLMKNSFNTYH